MLEKYKIETLMFRIKYKGKVQEVNEYTFRNLMIASAKEEISVVFFEYKNGNEIRFDGILSSGETSEMPISTCGTEINFSANQKFELLKFKGNKKREEKKKEEIKEWLDSMDIKNYTINEDGTVDVNGHVDLYGQGLTEIPVQFNKVTGNFYCSSNNLLTLKGSPKECYEFSCNCCQLKTLEGAPEKCVGFYCSYNQLTSLEGAPKICTEDFYCDNNMLISLEGCPRECNMLFYCSYNQLTSLEYAPKECKVFDCGKNPGKFTKEDVLAVCKAEKIIV